MSRKNVLYIGNYLNRPDANPTYMISLGSFLSDVGYHMSYASGQSNKILRLLHMIWAVILKARKLDFVLIDTYSTQNFYYALIISQLCRLFGFKYIPILHGGNLGYRLEHNPKMCKLIFKNAYLNVSPSIFLAQLFKDAGHTNVKFIPNAIKIEEFPYSAASQQGIKMFWLRSFSEIYNPEMAIRVAEYLKESGVDCSLTMVGPDSAKNLQNLREMAGVREIDVNFPGKLDKEDWIDLAREHNVFLNTSNFDNMPLSVIEIMALGLPVVSTDVGGMPYLITHGENGLLVEKNDHESMAEKVIELAKNPDLSQSISTKARELVERYDWSVVGQKWKEVLA